MILFLASCKGLTAMCNAPSVLSLPNDFGWASWEVCAGSSCSAAFVFLRLIFVDLVLEGKLFRKRLARYVTPCPD